MTDLNHDVRDVDRTHRPDLERTAINQMPKDKGWTELKLWQFDGTTLFQWRGRQRMRGMGEDFYYAWDDQATEVFNIIGPTV